MQKLRKIPWVDELVVGDSPGVVFLLYAWQQKYKNLPGILPLVTS